MTTRIFAQDRPVGAKLRQLVRANRRGRVVTSLASVAEGYLRAYYNEDHHDFDRNGEGFVLQTLADHTPSGPLVVWDVGAHEGNWSVMAHRFMPAAEVHAIEIVPKTRERLEQLAETESWLHPHGFGLSDSRNTVEVTVSSADSTLSSLSPRVDHWTFQAGSIETVEAEVMSGDELIDDGELPPPNVLKVDVEGHEVAVMRGLAKLLAGDAAPMFIQFEYGTTFVQERSTLAEIYDLLEPNGYAVGRVFPNHVSFEDYRLESEHYRMGNYIAAKDPKLIAALSNQSD